MWATSRLPVAALRRRLVRVCARPPSNGLPAVAVCFAEGQLAAPVQQREIIKKNHRNATPTLPSCSSHPPVCRQQGGSVRHDPGQGTISEISAVCLLHHAGVLAGETRAAGQGRLFQRRQQQAAQGHHRSLARRGHCECVVVFNVDRAGICCFFCAGSVGVKSTGAYFVDLRRVVGVGVNGVFFLASHEAPQQHNSDQLSIPSASLVRSKPSFVFTSPSPPPCPRPLPFKIPQTVCPAGTLKKHARQLQAGEIQTLPPPGVDGAGPAVAPTGAGAAAIADELMSQLRRAHCALVSCCCCIPVSWALSSCGVIGALCPVFKLWISPRCKKGVRQVECPVPLCCRSLTRHSMTFDYRTHRP